MIEERYGIDPGKIAVVYNAVTRAEADRIYRTERRGTPRDGKMVLFLGRITFQKGPDYFVEAAARVLKVLPEVTFVMAGAGDMMGQMIERVGELGIGNRFHFTGFLQGEEIERIFSLSDLYVMPSVSEPFGISPLEAMLYDVPVIISRQSGVAEILKHALKVDFWDVREIAGKIIAVLKYPVLAGEMARKGAGGAPEDPLGNRRGADRGDLPAAMASGRRLTAAYETAESESMPSVCLYFQVHQPCRLRRYSFFDIGHLHDYEDETENRRILDRVAEKCYLPADALLLS